MRALLFLVLLLADVLQNGSFSAEVVGDQRNSSQLLTAAEQKSTVARRQRKGWFSSDCRNSCFHCGDGRSFLVQRATDKSLEGRNCREITFESEAGVA